MKYKDHTTLEKFISASILLAPLVLFLIWNPVANTLYRTFNGEEFMREKCARRDHQALGVSSSYVEQYCDKYFGYQSPRAR